MGGFYVDVAVECVGAVFGSGVGVIEVVVSPSDVVGEAGDGILDVVSWGCWFGDKICGRSQGVLDNLVVV